VKYWFVFLLLTGLTGCAGLSELNHAGSPGSGEIVLAGRIAHDLPLRPDEQELLTLDSGRYRNKLLVVVGPEHIDLREPGCDALRNAAVVTPGEEFYIRGPRRDTLVYPGGSMLMNAHKSGRIDYLHLPDAVRFQTRPDDEVVYLGTLIYHRDDYNGIAQVELVDQHAASQQAFRQQFGKSLHSRRAGLEGL
jgi:hypothetical protein